MVAYLREAKHGTTVRLVTSNAGSETLPYFVGELRRARTVGVDSVWVRYLAKFDLLAELLDGVPRLQGATEASENQTVAVSDLRTLIDSVVNHADVGALLAGTLVDRAVESVLRIYLDASKDGRRGDSAVLVAQHNPDGSDGLERMVAAYLRDSSAARRAAVGLIVAAGAALALAAVILLVAASYASAHGAGPHLHGGGLFFAISSGCIPLIALALVFCWLASRQRLNGREALRLARQLPGLAAYLQTLPPQAAHLMRMSMMQRLFPRLLEDTDPLREVSWPETEEMISALKDGAKVEVNG